MEGHDHEHHDHDHDHEHHEHEGEDAEAPDLSEWASNAPTTTCPNCGASGAVMLGGGVFCPTCEQVSKSPGFQAPS